MSNLGIYLIAAIIGAYLVSMLMDGVIQTASAELGRDIRERIWQRQARGARYWRSLDTLGFLLVAAGILKVLGVLHTARSMGAWGIPCMVLGLLAVCSASTLRICMLSRYYRAEAPDTKAYRQSRKAALMVSLTEVALGLFVCGFVFIPLFARAEPAPNITSFDAPSAGAQTAGDKTPEKIWVDEREALQLLPGKNAEYLNLLVQHDDVRSVLQDGRTLYHRDDIVKTVETPLPTVEDLKHSLALRKTDAEKPVQVEEPRKAVAPKQELKED